MVRKENKMKEKKDKKDKTPMFVIPDNVDTPEKARAWIKNIIDMIEDKERNKGE